MYIILNPKMTKCKIIHKNAEINPTRIPRTMAIIAQRFSFRVFVTPKYVTF